MSHVFPRLFLKMKFSVSSYLSYSCVYICIHTFVCLSFCLSGDLKSLSLLNIKMSEESANKRSNLKDDENNGDDDKDERDDVILTMRRSEYERHLSKLNRFSELVSSVKYNLSELADSCHLGECESYSDARKDLVSLSKGIDRAIKQFESMKK